MRVHLACDNDIHPPLFGATQRLFGLARGLATRAEVDALCVVPARSTGASEERVAGVALHRRKAPHTSVAWWLQRARVAPLFTSAWGHRANAAAYRRTLGAPADVLMCDLALTGLFEGAPETVRAYHAHNVEARLWPQTAPPVWGRAAWARRLEDLERRAVANSDLCIACTDEDAEALRTIHGARDVEVVPNGYDETALAPASPEARARARQALGIAPDAYVAAFVGGDWGPNHDAVSWLVREVGPRLASDGGVLLVVGAVARRLADRREPWLVTCPETPELATVLAAADAGLNPIASGGGSNVKVPTYLACGLAVVSTAFGLRGYAPLSSAVTVAPLDGFADALRARPRGWAASVAPAPSALAGYAWGALGAALADAFAARLAVRRRGVA